VKGVVQITRFSKSEYLEHIRLLDERKPELMFEPQLPLGRMTKRRSENVVTDAADAVPDCVTCGVCCSFALVVPAGKTESHMLPAYWEIYPDDAPEQPPIMRIMPRDAENGHCVNLDGEIGKKVGCSVYGDRPAACRDFEAGSDRCREYRRMYGIEPQLSENEAAAFSAKLEQTPAKGVISYAAIIVDWISTVSTASADDPETTKMTKRSQLKIVAFVDEDETPHQMHSYDPAEETWFEEEFLGMSVDDAKEMISRTGSKEIN
jgi:Fe-S-cluster containining protein